MRAAASRITDKKEVLLSSVPIDESIYEVPAPYPDAVADTYLPNDVSFPFPYSFPMDILFRYKNNSVTHLNKTFHY